MPDLADPLRVKQGEYALAVQPRRWLMMGFVFTLYFTFGLMVASMAPLVSIISSDLGLSSAQMGAVLGAWQLTYIGVALWAGLLIDRFGLRRMLAIGALIMGLSSFLRASADGFPILFGSVALFGLGAPLISIGTPKFVSQWFDPQQRGGALGLVNAGPSLGWAVSLAGTHSVLLPLLESWRLIFVTYGIFATVLASLWFLVARDRTPPSQEGSGGLSPLMTYVHLIKLRNVQLVLIGAIAIFAINHGFSNWMPFVLESKNFAASHAGYWAALASLATAVGVATLPRFVPPHRRIPALAIIAVVLGVSGIGIGFFDGAPLLAMVLTNGFIRSVPMAFWFLVLMDTKGVGSRYIGSAVGLFFVVAEIGGFAGPWSFGLLLDYSGSILFSALLLAFVGLCMAPVSLMLRTSTACIKEPGDR